MLRSTVLSLAVVPAAIAYTRSDGTGRLPAMGWNSWNAYYCDVDETKMMQAANDIVNEGFRAAGYEYIVLDDCWSIQTGRDNDTNRIQPDLSKFPSGIDGWVDKVHALRLKAGIYSSAGYLTCGGYPASLGYEMVDATTFAEWGVDYLKYDNCGYPAYWDEPVCYSCNADPTFANNLDNGTCTDATTQGGVADMMPICGPEWPVDGRNYSQSYTAQRYRIMENALLAQDRTILYSLCDWGTNEPWTWGNATGQSWRMSNDIASYWSSVTRILNMNSFLSNFGDFGGHNDPDMLHVGNGNLTTEECRSHFALWAMMKSPLLIGTDISKLSKTNIKILQNKYLIAFNQDPVYGKGASPYKWGINPDWTYNSTHPAEFWSGQSSKGVMVAMMNTLDNTRTMTADFSEIPQLGKNSYRVINAWTGENMGCRKGSVKMSLKAHDTAVLLLKDNCV